MCVALRYGGLLKVVRMLKRRSTAPWLLTDLQAGSAPIGAGLSFRRLRRSVVVLSRIGFFVFAASMAGAVACGGGAVEGPGGLPSGMEDDAAEAGGDGGSANEVPSGQAEQADAGAPETMAGPDGYPIGCPENRPLRDEATGRLRVTVALQSGPNALAFGERNPVGADVEVLPTNLRFYLSQIELKGRGYVEKALPLLPEGSVAPYGVQLVSADNPNSLVFELAAPPGT